MLEFTLRPLKMEDVSAFARHANNPRIAANVRNVFPHPYTEADGRKFIEQVKDMIPAQVMAIDIHGEACGAIGVHPQDDVHEKSAEVGYWLGEQYWGQGIATRALQQIIPYTFAHWDIVRLYAVVFHTNIGSQRALEKAGFRQEARLKMAAYKNGEFMDELIYAIIRP